MFFFFRTLKSKKKERALYRQMDVLVDLRCSVMTILANKVIDSRFSNLCLCIHSFVFRLAKNDENDDDEEDDDENNDEEENDEDIERAASSRVTDVR